MDQRATAAEPEHEVRGRTWSAMMTNWAGSGMEPCEHREMDTGTDHGAGASEDECSRAGAGVDSLS